jgi:DNA-binding beta-propeller fold protein YncE
VVDPDRYNAQGELVSEFGSVGSGTGQFYLVHGVAVDREHRVYVSDRDNNRIQVFTEAGEFIEEWPDVLGPTGIYIDERENVWVLSTTLNQILQFDLNGELQYQFGAYRCTRRLRGRLLPPPSDDRGPGGQPLRGQL